ncbi:MAG: hypothetical protein H7256_01730 [Bdellovibrio sp.]|nr:hypothetical protein [Bdellovibrio sp.]
MIFVLMALLIIVFSFAFLSFVAQSKMQFRTACTNDSIELQKKIIVAEKTLFALNPVSTALKIAYHILELERLAALANPELLPIIEAKIQQVTAARQALDKSQKAIIRAAELIIKVEIARSTVAMNKTAYETRDRWSYFLQSVFIVKPDRIPKFAVQPDSDDIASNYGLTKGYKQEQMVAYNWQLLFFTKNDVQQVLESRGLFEMACGATADKDDKKWLVEIRKDKF